MKKILFPILLLILSIPAFADDFIPFVDSEYYIDINPGNRTLHVKAVFKGLDKDYIYIGFNHYLHYGCREGNLHERISSLKTAESNVNLASTENEQIYKIQLNGKKTFTLEYDFYPGFVMSDHHLTVLTDTMIHIPGKDFFIRAYLEMPDEIHTKEELPYGHHCYKSYKVVFNNLPGNWEIITTYKKPDSNSVLIDDRSGHDVLISAGIFKKLEFLSGNSGFTVALDKGLIFNIDKYEENIKSIIDYYISIYKEMPESRNLMVIYQDPVPKHFSIGGQVKEQNIIISLSGNTENKEMLLDLIAHESHHIWLSRAFNVRGEDEWPWCWEGFTVYMAAKSLYKCGITSGITDFQKQVFEWYNIYNSLSIKNTESVVEASRTVYPEYEESQLQYKKGALIAFLLDRELEEQNLSIESFLNSLYYTYSLNNYLLEIGNAEIISFIDQYLGNSIFSETYITGTNDIELSDLKLPAYYAYFWWPVENNFLPPVIFPLNLLTVLLLILLAVLNIYINFKYLKLPKNILGLLISFTANGVVLFLFIKFVYINLYILIPVVFIILFSVLFLNRMILKKRFKKK